MANAEATVNIRLMDLPEVKKALDDAEGALRAVGRDLERMARAIHDAEFAADGACPFCTRYDGHAPDCVTYLAKFVLKARLST
ncbi:MAG TPA: hypothetical protein VFL91_15255 [Thermomicrobiales bacterium]|nr:hypothetical protein [Thermomicrobiales bacterium]